MKTAIVPLDGSSLAEQALSLARHLAAPSGANIVVAINPATPVAASGGTLPDEPTATTRSAVSGAEKTVPATTPEDILALAESLDDPVIVMAAQPRAGIVDALVATVDETVVRRARCPIFLVGPRCPSINEIATRRNLLVCTDGSAYSEAVVPASAELAKALGLHLVVFQVSPSGILVSHVGRARDVASAERFAAALREQGLHVECRTLRDPDPAAAIHDFASTRSPACIAIATHGRTGLARVVLGSVAADVVRDAECPVLLVRPRLDD